VSRRSCSHVGTERISYTVLRPLWLNTRTGWTVGAGYEYVLGYGWSIKGEYLYVRFEDYTTFTTPPFGGFGLNIAPRNNRLDENVFRAGMNYKIGWY
jgi:outer membrane immunogenic protein